MRPIAKPETSTPVQVRFENEMTARIDAVAAKSGQSNNSAVIRAAVRLGLRALEVKPEMVRQIEAGTMDGGTLAEFVTRFALLFGYHVAPQTSEERAASEASATMEALERMTAGIPAGHGVGDTWGKAIAEEMPKLLSQPNVRASLEQVVAEIMARNTVKTEAGGENSANPAASKPAKRKARK